MAQMVVNDLEQQKKLAIAYITSKLRDKELLLNFSIDPETKALSASGRNTENFLGYIGHKSDSGGIDIVLKSIMPELEALRNKGLSIDRYDNEIVIADSKSSLKHSYERGALKFEETVVAFVDAGIAKDPNFEVKFDVSKGIKPLNENAVRLNAALSENNHSGNGDVYGLSAMIESAKFGKYPKLTFSIQENVLTIQRKHPFEGLLLPSSTHKPS